MTIKIYIVFRGVNIVEGVFSTTELAESYILNEKANGSESIYTIVEETLKGEDYTLCGIAIKDFDFSKLHLAIKDESKLKYHNLFLFEILEEENNEI